MIILEEEEIVLQVEEAFLESDVPYYEGEYTVTPTGEAQTLPTGGMQLEEDIVVEPVPGGELATPSIDVSSSGLITAQAGVSESGYIADTDTKSATQQLSTQAGKTVTPTESEQTAVDEHKYTTGKVKVAAVPSDYVGSGIARKDSSSLSASGKRVTAPAGYYAEAAGKEVAGGSATTPATEITANPSISVDANGLITAGVSKTQSITPTVVEGYVEDGTAGNVSVSGSATSQLPTDNGSEVTPSTQEQTLNLSGKFMKGNVKVKKIPSEYVVPSGTKNITANGNAQDVKSYENVNVNVPNSYSQSDEGKVVQSGALVSQSSATYTENGTYDTTTKNEVVVDVQGGGGGRVLLASLTALQNEPTMSINYDAQTMGAYKVFEMEVTGTASGNLYICPQLNGTSSRGYWGNHLNAAFYRRFMVPPTYALTGLTIAGYNVDYGNGYGASFWLASDTITSFDLRSYYDTSAYFGAGTVFNVYGYPE